MSAGSLDDVEEEERDEDESDEDEVVADESDEELIEIIDEELSAALEDETADEEVGTGVGEFFGPFDPPPQALNIPKVAPHNK